MVHELKSRVSVPARGIMNLNGRACDLYGRTISFRPRSGNYESESIRVNFKGMKSEVSVPARGIMNLNTKFRVFPKFIAFPSPLGEL